MRIFIPDLDRISTWPLLLAVAIAALVAFGPRELSMRGLRSGGALLMVPWVLLAGLAADRARVFWASRARGPQESFDLRLFDLFHFVPVAGLGALLIALLLGVAARRNPEVPSDRVVLVLHALPAAFLVYHGWNYGRTMAEIAQAEAGSPSGSEFAAALDTGIVGLSTLAALAAVLVAGFRVARGRRAIGE